MIELLFVVSIIGILAALAAPSFNTWIMNNQIRTVTDSIQNGLQLARSEAVHRNTPIRFEMVSSIDNSCATSTNSGYWVVSQINTLGLCGSAPSDTAAAPDPLIIQKHSGLEGGTTTTTIVATQSLVVFNGLGRQATVTDGTTTPSPPVNVSIDVTNPTGGACIPAGAMKCLRVVVSAAGQIRMCNPSLTQAANPSGC